MSALMVAVEYEMNTHDPPDNVEEVKALLDYGAKRDVREENGFEPIIIAAETGKLKMARLLIDRGADVNATNGGTTVLMYAILWGREKVCELLLERGAALDTQGSDGRTALMRAISGQDENIVRLLLAKKANINLRANNGETALSIAERKLLNFVPALEKAGAIE
jgi:hypothetical protein